MKKQIRKLIDKSGISIFRNSVLPVGTDYRKTIRELFGMNEIKVVFDVGANVGQFCNHCSEVFDKAKIYSFEPIKETYEKLVRNTKETKNINCFNFAFGDTKGKEEIFLQESSVINSLNPAVNIRENENQKSQIIEINTIDSYCRDNRIDQIDLLKIDTEGFDLNVLKGARAMLEQRKVKFVFIEVTFDKDNAHNSSYNTINAFLEPMGYKIHGFYNQSIHLGSSQMNYCDALFYLQPK